MSVLSKSLVCAAVIFLFCVLFLRFQNQFHGNPPKPGLEQGEQRTASSVSLAPLESFSERAMESQYELASRQRRIQLIDKNTSTSLGLVGVEVLVPEIDSISLQTDKDGWVDVPALARSIRPSNGFAFISSPCLDVKAGGQLLLEGQFRVRLNGGTSISCAVYKDRRLSGWLELLSGLSASASEFRTSHREEDGFDYVVFASQPKELSLYTHGFSVSPGHPLWAGRVTPLQGGRTSSEYPLKGGPAPISNVFMGKAGESHHFRVLPTLTSADITFLTNRGGHLTGTVSLAELKTLEEGKKTIRMPISLEAIDGHFESTVFESVPQGVYYVTSALHSEGELWLSSSRVEITGEDCVVIEEMGMGAYTLDIECEPKDWFIQTLLSESRGLPTTNVPIKADLSAITRVLGIPHSKCKLYLTHGKDGKKPELVRLTLDRNSKLAVIE